MKKQKVFKKRGFTIAEMFLVAITMIVLFSIGTRTYYRERDRFEFNNAFTEMLEIIKTARNYAITSYSIYVPTLPSDERNIIPVDGYGVHINLQPQENKPHFTLFANKGTGTTKEDFQYDDDPNTFDTNDEVIKTYRLPKQVRFQYFIFGEDIKWGGDPKGPTATEAVIIFKPPLADTFIGNNDEIGLNELRMRFFNPEAPEESPKRCQYIRINRVKTFAQLEYSDCSEFNI